MYSTNYTSNYNQLKDIKDVNNVAGVPISKDAERMLSLKANLCVNKKTDQCTRQMKLFIIY